MTEDDQKYRNDLESIIAKLGKYWRNLPLEEVIRYCTTFKVVSSIREGGFTVLMLKGKRKRLIRR